MTKLNVGLFLGTLVAFGGGGMLALAKKDDDGHDRGVRRAQAVVVGPGIHGIVTFKQEPCPGCPVPDARDPKNFRNFPQPEVRVDAKIRGLTPGAHGFHIHENGACEPTFGAAGAHYDPSHPGDAPANQDHPWHMGDLPNLVAGKNGHARLHHTTSRITLSPSETGVFDPPPEPPRGGAPGSAVIVHAGPDLGTPGNAGGGRIACGVIKPDKSKKSDE